MAKNLKTLLNIFTRQRHDIRDAMHNILYSLNNEVSSKKKLLLNPDLEVHHIDSPINSVKEADDIRRYIVGNDSLGLNQHELRILQEMALSWGSLEQCITAINLFLGQYKIIFTEKEKESPEKMNEILKKNVGFYIVDIRRNMMAMEHKFAVNTENRINWSNRRIRYEEKPTERFFPADNDLHIFLSHEFYKDKNEFYYDKDGVKENVERRTITPNIVDKIGEFVPATVDTIFYKHLTDWEQYVAFSKKLHYWEFKDGGWRLHIDYALEKLQDIGFKPHKGQVFILSDISRLTSWERFFQNLTNTFMQEHGLLEVYGFSQSMTFYDIWTIRKKRIHPRDDELRYVENTLIPAYLSTYKQSGRVSTMLFLQERYKITTPNQHKEFLQTYIDIYNEHNTSGFPNIVQETYGFNTFYRLNSTDTSFVQGKNSILYRILEKKGSDYVNNRA